MPFGETDSDPEILDEVSQPWAIMSKQYKRLRTPEDVRALIDQGIRESDILEYKSIKSATFSDGEKKELPKDVSAMRLRISSA